MSKILRRSALDLATVPSSYNAEARTCEFVISTEAPVLRAPYEHPMGKGEYWFEILSHEPGHVRLERANKGQFQVLDNHLKNRPVNECVFGSSIPGTARIENRELIVGVLFRTTPAADAVFRDLGNGSLRCLSAQYQSFRYVKAKESVNEKLETFICVDWEPKSGDPVDISADHNVRVRNDHASRQTKSAYEENQEVKKKPSDKEPGPSENGQEKQGTTPEPETPPQSTAPETPQPETIPAPRNGQRSGTLPAYKVISNKTRKELMTLGRSAGLHDVFFDEEGHELPLDDVVSNVTQALSQRSIGAGRPLSRALTLEHGDNAHLKEYGRVVRDAIELKMGYHLDDSAMQDANTTRQLSRRSALDIGRKFIEVFEQSTDLDDTQTAERLLTDRGRSATTGDFSSVISEIAINRAARQYEGPRKIYEPIVRRVPVSNFLPQTIGIVQENQTLNERVEGGEILYESFIKDSGRTYKTARYFGGILVTFETLINDQLRLIKREIDNTGNQVTRLERKNIFGPMIHNTAMFNVFDGAKYDTSKQRPLFVEGVNKLWACPIDQDGWEKAAQTLYWRAGLITQKDLSPDSDDYILPLESEPKYVLVSRKRKEDAVRILTPYSAHTKQDINLVVAQYKETKIIVVPELDILNMPDKWFMTSDPNNGPGGIEISHLYGDSSLKVHRKVNDATGDLKITCSYSAGFGFIDPGWIVEGNYGSKPA